MADFRDNLEFVLSVDVSKVEDLKKLEQALRTLKDNAMALSLSAEQVEQASQRMGEVLREKAARAADVATEKLGSLVEKMRSAGPSAAEFAAASAKVAEATEKLRLAEERAELQTAQFAIELNRLKAVETELDTSRLVSDLKKFTDAESQLRVDTKLTAAELRNLSAVTIDLGQVEKQAAAETKALAAANEKAFQEWQRAKQEAAQFAAFLDRLAAEEEKAARAADVARIRTAGYAEELRQLKAVGGTIADNTERQATSQRNYATVLQQSTKHSNEHSAALKDVASGYLFMRRVILAVGLSAFTAELINVTKELDKMSAQLNVAFGGNAPEVFAFLKSTADRLGISILNITDQYTKFMLAVKDTKISAKDAQDSFVAVAEATTALGLSQADTNGVLAAMAQIAGKGVLQMEELRQQLGDRFPGIVPTVAKALGVTQQRLFALVEQGRITSDMFFRVLPDAIRQTIGVTQNTRIETFTAQIERLKNAMIELTDKAIRPELIAAAGAAIRALTNAVSDPEVQNQVRKLAAAFAEVIDTVRNFGPELGTLVKGLRILVEVGTALAPVLLLVFGAQRYLAFVAAASTATVAMRAMATEMSVMAANGTAAARAQGSLAASSGLVSKLLGAAGAAAGALALLYAGAELAAAKLAAAQERQIAKDLFGKQIQQQSELASRLEKNAEIQRQAAQSETASAQEVYAAQAKAIALSIQAAKIRIQVERDKIQQLRESGASEKEIQEAIKGSKLLVDNYQLSIQRWEINLRQVEQAARDAGVSSQDSGQKAIAAVNAHIARLKDLGLKINENKDLTEAAAAADALLARQNDLEIKSLIDKFDQAREKGTSARDAIEQIIPPDFGKQGAERIQEVLIAMELLQRQGKLSLEDIRTRIAETFSGLNPEQINTFAVNIELAMGKAGKAMGVVKETAKALAKDGLEKLGIDAEASGSKISKAFGDKITILESLRQTGQATADQLTAAFNALRESAKTADELELLRQKMIDFGIATEQATSDSLKKIKELDNGVQVFSFTTGTANAKAIDAFQRLEDKIRSMTGVLDSAVGDSFRRFGLETSATIKATAEQFSVDFDRIVKSGQATATNLTAAFSRSALDIIAKSGDLNKALIFKIQFQAVNLGAFDVIVASATTASEKVKAAFQSAVSSVTNEEQLKLLGESLEKQVARGAIAWDDYLRAADSAITKTFELATRGQAGLEGALSRLGVQTQTTLQTIADQYTRDFDLILSRGTFTTEELQKAFNTWAEAVGRASGYSRDALESVRQKAADVGVEMAGVTQKFEEAAKKALSIREQFALDAKKVQTFDGTDLKTLNSIGDFQKWLSEQLKALGQVGYMQEALAKYKADMEAAFRSARPDLFQAKQTGGTGLSTTSAPSITPTTTAGPIAKTTQATSADQIINFNFNSANVTPRDIVTNVVPALTQINQRRL